MTRSRASARAAGTRMESKVVAYLNRVLGTDVIERRARTGAKDQGDVAGFRTADGQRIVVEVKDVVKHDLPGWLREAEAERVNDDALAGVVWAKRRGAASPGDCFVIMTGDDFMALRLGRRPEPLELTS